MALACVSAVSAGSPPPIRLGISSQQAGPSRATVEARIDVRKSKPGRESQTSSPRRAHLISLPVGGAGEKPPEPYPPLPTDSSLARNTHPFGPGTFWYPIGPGRVCIYVADSSAPCYRLVGSGGGAGGPALDPGAIAASVADRLGLLPGRIRTSPSGAGLTGADSWFWLDPVPEAEELTVSLAGETVKVTAEPGAVEWGFGDGANLHGGAGLSYRPGPRPSDAVVHVYETRCLPGDPGRDPYVLGSCRSDGYPVEATVVWRISYSARGPIGGSGALSTRTTGTSIVYPVSEVRAFLVAGGSR